MKAKVRKTAGALAHMVIQVGGDSVSLFGSGGLRAMMLGSQNLGGEIWALEGFRVHIVLIRNYRWYIGIIVFF